jgi:hypothetical protein
MIGMVNKMKYKINYKANDELKMTPSEFLTSKGYRIQHQEIVYHATHMTWINDETNYKVILYLYNKGKREVMMVDNYNNYAALPDDYLKFFDLSDYETVKESHQQITDWYGK